MKRNLSSSASPFSTYELMKHFQADRVRFVISGSFKVKYCLECSKPLLTINHRREYKKKYSGTTSQKDSENRLLWSENDPYNRK